MKDKRIEQVLEVLFFQACASNTGSGRTKQIVLTPKPSKENFPRRVRGIITDGSGVPVIGATVLVVGTNNGLERRRRQAFSIAVQSPDDVSVLFLGWSSRRIRVGNRTVIDVILSGAGRTSRRSSSYYGVQEKANMSGAVASVNFEGGG